MLHATLILLLAASASHAQSNWHAPNCEGNRRAIVHLFEWKWTDVAAECERFLGPRGFCGVQVSSPNENAVIMNESEPPRPWWERYQPVSYKMETRSGTEEQFVDMVTRCNNVGVRIYADVIVNHMTGMGRSGLGTGGTEFDADSGYYPGVPYEMDNFNGCENCGGCCCVDSWTDHARVRNCRLVGLIDLNQRLTDTHDKIVAYLNKLLSYGVAGFRVDAAKHMWPEDLESIWNDLTPTTLPNNPPPFIYLEVIDMNQNGEINVREYIHLGRVTEFRFCVKVKEASGALWSIPGVYDPGWNMCDPGDAFVFVDNHDNQRGHGAGGDVLNYKNPRDYKIAQAISLGWDYGYQRVMSSYDFGDDTDVGPPHDGDYNTIDVPINSDGSCGGGWVCEHRWPAVAGMVGWSKATNGGSIENWWTQGNSAAWSKGGQGFVAISNEGLSTSLQTGLPAGSYCNVIQGCATESGCEGDTITVNGDGTAQISISDNDNPIVAIHVEAMSGSGQCVQI